MNAQRVYKTTAEHRLVSKMRRDELRASNLCINSRLHGPATVGVRCTACAETHRKSA